jgi:hypothetical protein
VDIDPVIPPVDRSRLISEGCFFVFSKRVGKPLDIICGEILLIVQNERFEKLDKLLHLFQIAFGAHQRGFLQRQRRHDALNGFHNRLLGGRRHTVVAFFGNRDRIQAKP